MRFFETCAMTKDEILLVFDKEKEIVFKTYSVIQKEERFLINTLEIILKHLGIEYLYDYTHYCLKELISNAFRANVKRVFFIESNLDINDASDYEKGMQSFKKYFNEKSDHYSNLLFDKDFYILVQFKLAGDIFSIEVINRAALLDKEYESINSNINSAKHFNSFEEALSIVTKESEGAGLGFIIIILMLKKIGLSRENLIFDKRQRETSAKLELPLTIVSIEQNQLISSLIINEINNLPTFPEHILNLQKKIDNPEISLNDIVNEISGDPSLVADVLKAANSPLYMFPGQISSVAQAVKLIGLRELKNIFFSFGSYHILNNRYDSVKMKNIWDHSQKVAFLSTMLAKSFLEKEYYEDSYVGGLLHDIGRILLLGVNSKLVLKMREVCAKKNIPLRILEDITSGYNHAIIGSMIAEKWNFPKKYINTIKYHNKPSVDENVNLVYCIYFANIMTHEDDKNEIYGSIHKDVLALFKVHDFKEYESLKKKLNDKYTEYENKSFFS